MGGSGGWPGGYRGGRSRGQSRGCPIQYCEVGSIQSDRA